MANKKEFNGLVKEALQEKEYELNAKQTAEITDTVFDVIFDLVSNKDEVTLGGLGKLTAVERGERKARNPQDPSVEIIVPVHHAAKFKVSKGLKEALKQK
jgi:nucleoid DNA-binding protein